MNFKFIQLTHFGLIIDCKFKTNIAFRQMRISKIKIPLLVQKTFKPDHKRGISIKFVVNGNLLIANSHFKI